MRQCCSAVSSIGAVSYGGVTGGAVSGFALSALRPSNTLGKAAISRLSLRQVIFSQLMVRKFIIAWRQCLAEVFWMCLASSGVAVFLSYEGACTIARCTALYLAALCRLALRRIRAVLSQVAMRQCC